jgi:hypothetical protein
MLAFTIKEYRKFFMRIVGMGFLFPFLFTAMRVRRNHVNRLVRKKSPGPHLVKRFQRAKNQPLYLNNGWNFT